METGTQTILIKLRAALRTLRDLRPGAQSLVCFFAAGILCASDLGVGSTAAGACLLGACSHAHLTPCVLGIAAGGILFQGLRAALIPWAVCAAVLCVRLLVPKGKQHIAVPAAGASACAVIGLIPVVAGGAAWTPVLRWAVHTALIAGGIVLFRAALIRKSYFAQVGALCALLPGFAALRLPGGWSLAAAALAWVSAAQTGPVYVCAGAAFMTAFHPDAAPCYTSFCLCALLYRLLRSRPAAACAAACGICTLTGLRFQSYGFSACAAAGALAAVFLRPDRFLPEPPRAALPKHPARKELRQAARALAQAADMLDSKDTDPRRELAAVLDSAEEQVCRNCAKHRSCREYAEQNAVEFSGHAAEILTSGAAKEDLPPSFLDRCIHPDAFLTAVNDAVDAGRAGQRFRRRLAETRRAAMAQYSLMGGLLDRLCDQLYAPERPVNFAPEISVRAEGRGGSQLSGDRGAAFAGPGATYYVLLCDGMGTGAPAAKESAGAVGLLRRLLLSGADAEGALRALNGIYLLRDDGCFSTVDLLRINLTSGDAILYKWGASASYLKRNRGLRRLGGAGLPPGLDEDGSPEALHLNLDRGGVLVLLSDGLSDAQTQRRLEHCGSLRPEDVAGSVFVGREPAADDCTAVAVRLRRAGQREPVPV